MPIKWRWDQGREMYWGFDNLRALAVGLVAAEGLPVAAENDPLTMLQRVVALPFARPSGYNLWRQYARVIKSAILGADIDGALKVTDLCRRMAGLGTGLLSVDEYLSVLARRFYFPSPAFAEYTATGTAVFPFALIIRHLISRRLHREEPSISVDEIVKRLAARSLTGREPLNELNDLAPMRDAGGTVTRQVREMMPLLGQATFLYWDSNNRLHLADDGRDDRDLIHLAQIMEPEVDLDERLVSPSEEILRLGGITTGDTGIIAVPNAAEMDRETFPEGSRVQVSHFRIERNTALRRAYFDHLQRANTSILCDVCALNAKVKYPWVNSFLEIHHLLPLASPVGVSVNGTTFADIKPICPNCHRAVHQFYGQWLQSNQMKDFPSRESAISTYINAKESYMGAQRRRS